MAKEIVSDVLDQYRRSFRMLYSEIERFSDEQWVKGISVFQTPVRQAMHALDCLDYYSCGRSGDQYDWGHRFGGGWWVLKVEQLPTKAAVIEYAKEIEARIADQIALLDDADLAEPFAINDGSGKTVLGHHLYALRHTMHHHGQLAALAVYHSLDGGSWE
jgi:uncharacterized damage-inducible protein DinB